MTFFVNGNKWVKVNISLLSPVVFFGNFETIKLIFWTQDTCAKLSKKALD